LKKSPFKGRDGMDNISTIEAMVKETVEGLGLELYEFKYVQSKRKKTLNIVVDHSSRSISIGDCERVSKAIGPAIDEQDLIDGSYFLEVSSPGVERALRKTEDYRRFTGETVKVIMKNPVEKRMVFIGKMNNYNEEKNEITVLERDSKREFTLSIDEIKKARLYLEV